MSDISSGNRVRVMRGEHKGRKGMVIAITGDRARLHLTKFGESVTVPISELRREYRSDENAPTGASLTMSAKRRARMRRRMQAQP